MTQPETPTDTPVFRLVFRAGPHQIPVAARLKRLERILYYKLGFHVLDVQQVSAGDVPVEPSPVNEKGS
jgi:hypothetical protein